MLVNRTTALLLLGQEEGWTEAARMPADAPTAQERLEIARGHVNVAEAAIAWGRYTDARKSLALGLRLTKDHHYPWLKCAAAAEELRLDWLVGAWGGLAKRAKVLSTDSDVPRVLQLRARLVAALLDVATGSRAGAAEKVQHLIDATRQLTITEYCIEPAALLGRLHLARGATDDALKVTDEMSELVARRGIWIWATELAPTRVQALLAAGRVEDALDFTNRFAVDTRNWSAPAPKAALILCRAALAETRGEHRHAASLFARTALVWDRLSRPYDALLAREQQAVSLLACDEAQAALDLLSDVRQQLITLGAVNDAERAVSTLRAQGVPAKRPQRGGWTAYGEQLSPRELEVARLVTAGRTNREIATVLSRSPKTVAAQLNSALRKLGVSTRTALAVRVVESGLVDDQRPVA
jgi:DNA-binding NarL/FixJ family response regulator